MARDVWGILYEYICFPGTSQPVIARTGASVVRPGVCGRHRLTMAVLPVCRENRIPGPGASDSLHPVGMPVAVHEVDIRLSGRGVSKQHIHRISVGKPLLPLCYRGVEG